MKAVQQQTQGYAGQHEHLQDVYGSPLSSACVVDLSASSVPSDGPLPLGKGDGSLQGSLGMLSDMLDTTHSHLSESCASKSGISVNIYTKFITHSQEKNLGKQVRTLQTRERSSHLSKKRQAEDFKERE